MLSPKKVKHRKWHKKAGASGGRIAARKSRVSFGDYGMIAVGARWVSAAQIEAARRVITRYVRRGGKMWIRIFPDKPVTAKGNEIPMGGGKGSVEKYVVSVRPGTVLFELAGVVEKDAKHAFTLAGHKLPVKTKFIVKDRV